MRLFRTLTFVCVVLTFPALPALQDQDFLQKAKNHLGVGNCDKAETAYEAYKVEYPAGNTEVKQRIDKYKKELKTFADDYSVDLGLPSGTWWKNKDESGFHNYDEALRLNGNKTPSKKQWEELMNYCT